MYSNVSDRIDRVLYNLVQVRMPPCQDKKRIEERKKTQTFFFLCISYSLMCRIIEPQRLFIRLNYVYFYTKSIDPIRYFSMDFFYLE